MCVVLAAAAGRSAAVHTAATTPGQGLAKTRATCTTRTLSTCMVASCLLFGLATRGKEVEATMLRTGARGPKEDWHSVALARRWLSPHLPFNRVSPAACRGAVAMVMTWCVSLSRASRETRWALPDGAAWGG